MKSETIGKLGEALAKAQNEMKNAAKDKNNPFFKSNYADLASVWDACREPLTKNGLSVSQPLNVIDGKLILTTILIHTSGEWISSNIPVNPVKNDPQGIGSAITYYRRFSLSALVGVAPSEKPDEEENLDDSDDDGNAATGKKQKSIPPCHCGTELVVAPSGKAYYCPKGSKEDPNHLKLRIEDLMEMQ